jgi:FKBP-type peptidyl-prolyl cis-trans isomerase FkpA
MSLSIRSTSHHHILALIVAVAALGAISCGGGDEDSGQPPTAPIVNVPFTQTDLRVGTGTEAAVGRRVTVHYTGWLYDPNAAENKGRQFDSSLTAGAPFPFTIGAREVIAGWDQGVPGMRVGGQRRLVIPPALAYGEPGRGPIPPNATLIFDIELLSVS